MENCQQIRSGASVVFWNYLLGVAAEMGYENGALALGIFDCQERLIMHIAHVFIHVKPGYIEAFTDATLDNARNSLLEPGVARFDIIQQQDDPTRFVLVEVSKTPADADSHKKTAHYARWRDAVADMMAEPRSAIKYANIHPGEDGWRAAQ